MRKMSKISGKRGGVSLASYLPPSNDELRTTHGKCLSPLLSAFLHFAFVVATLCIATTVMGADWTDANSVTYTALKSINGGGGHTTAGGLIITDIKPVSNNVVRLKFVPTSLTGNACLYCCRQSTKNNTSGTVSKSFAGFRISSSIRLDRNATNATCNDHNPIVIGDEYSLAVDYGSGTVEVNGTPETLSKAMIPDAAAGEYSPGNGSKYIVLLASYMMKDQVTTSSTFSNYSSEDLYYFQLWSAAGALEHNLMPASRDSDSAVGLYDTVTRKFYAASKNTLAGTAKSAVTGTPVKWTGAGDGVTMSSGANWEGGNPPQDGDDLDFTIAVPNAAINADIPATFGKMWLGDGDGPVFTGSLSVTSVNDGTKVRGAVTIVACYSWNGTGTNWSDADAWTFDGAPVTWSDGVNAVFGTANAAAALTADASANSLSFTQPAAISGSSTLTVPSVSVASGVSAAITAPTAGPLEITGGGTLTLGSSRAAATTLTEGTLKMSPGATVSSLTLGTDDPTKPVTFDYGGQTLTALPAAYLVTGSDITLTNGTFTSDGTVNIRDSTKIPSVLTIAKDATLEKSGAANHFVILNTDGTTTVNVAGGSIVSAYTTYFQHMADTGTLRVNVTDGGIVSLDYSLYALCYGSEGASPSLHIRVVDSTFRVGNSGSGDFRFGNHTTAPVDPTGVFAATNSTICVGEDFIIGRRGTYEYTSGSYTADFEGCVVTGRSFCVYWDRPLNRARFNGTRYVFSADGKNIAVCDDNAKWITVDAGGLVIDTQNYSDKLNADLGGTGAVTKVGTGTLTVNSNQSSSAALNVDEGTLAINSGLSIARPIAVASGATLKFLGSASPTSLALTDAAAVDIATVSPVTVATSATLPASGTVALTFNGGAFPVGIYRLFAYSGVAAADGEKFAPATGDESAAWSVINGALTLTVGNPPNTWIGGAGGSLSDTANWSLGRVPGRGDTAAVGAGSAATFTVGAAFCPDVIIIPEGSADVTFSGENALSGIIAVSNLSANVCTFEVPVAFADEINVYQTAYYYLDSSNSKEQAGGHVRFAGGVTGNSFAEGTTRRLDGAYTISATSGWIANDNSANAIVWGLVGATAAGASSLTITGSSYETPGTTDTSMLLIGGGSAFTTGVVRTSARVSYRNYGEYVVTGELEVTLPGSALYIAQRYDGTYKFEKFTLGDKGTAQNFWVSTSNNSGSKKYLYIGAGGINFKSGAKPATAMVVGYRSGDEIWLYPWHSDYTIAGKDGESTRDIIIHKPTHILTDDENGVARTVTINGIADVRTNLNVEGHGTLRVNSDGISASGIGDIFVNDHATLAFAPGADLGDGAITVDTNATLKVAGSGTVTVAGGLTLLDGATLAFNFTEKATAPTLAVATSATLPATVNVKITSANGLCPKSGEHLLTTCGGLNAAGVTVSLAADAPEWAAGCLSVNAAGNLVLTVKSKGTIISIR